MNKGLKSRLEMKFLDKKNTNVYFQNRITLTIIQDEKND